MVIHTDPAQTQAHRILMGHVTDLAEGGQHVPCLGPEGAWFTEDDPEIQRAAARLCRDCPALAACAQYIAEHPEPAGVWAGSTEKTRPARRSNR